MSKMKFKEGDAIEVRRGDGGIVRSWFRAKVISGNVHTYKVRYESILNADGKLVIEDVYAEAVRPQPPAMTETKKLAAGNSVEVYNNHSWTEGKVVKTLPGRFFVVKLVEPLGEKRCHQSIIRPRLSWQDNHWIRITEDDMDLLLKTGFQSQKESHNAFQFLDLGVRRNGRNQNHGQGEAKLSPWEFLAKSAKRKADSQMQSAHEGDLLKNEVAPQKRRAIQSSKHQGPITKSSISVQEKVNTFLLRRKKVDQECEYMSPFKGRINQSAEESESSHSSVASNGASCVSNYMSQVHKKISNQHAVNSPFDDAQSSGECPNGTKSEPLTKMDIAATVHKLELCAYQKIIRAFYACGCLTWEQEALMTDLRLSLHISEDEHKCELTRLSTAKALHISEDE